MRTMLVGIVCELFRLFKGGEFECVQVERALSVGFGFVRADLKADNNATVCEYIASREGGVLFVNKDAIDAVRRLAIYGLGALHRVEVREIAGWNGGVYPPEEREPDL